MVSNLQKCALSAQPCNSSKAGWYKFVSNPRWYRMQARFGAYFLFALIAAPIASASASGMPDIKSGPSNAVPQCVTPGRLLAYLKSRNPELDRRFESLPGEYMRLGEDLGVRWDYAFYQMVLETGALSFKSSGRAGDVKPNQNNFAGLGATGKGAPGESFTDIATGVRAHLEHLLLYAGSPVASPVAERTRKVHEWGVLTSWQAGFTRPITFADLAAKWAPGSNAYSKNMESVAQGFQDFCRKPDPKPDLLAAVRRSRLAAAEQEAAPERPGQALARRAIETGKSEQDNRRLGLGAQEPAQPGATLAKAPPTPFKILNAPAEPEQERPPVPLARVQTQPVAQPTAQPVAQPVAQTPEQTPAFRSGMLNMPSRQPPREPMRAEPAAAPALPQAAPQQPAPQAPAAQAPAAQAPAAQPPAAQPPAAQAKAAPPATPRKDVKVASAATAARPAGDAVAAGQKCRVWTASYGGQKALIIRSVIDRVINFTVLDVNEGAEKREADAFIAAYAKNGAVTGEYTSQTVALDKAFELCPEG